MIEESQYEDGQDQSEIYPYFYSILRVPFNLIVKNFKNEKRALEKRIASTLKKISDIKNKKFQNTEQMIEYITSLKEELKKSQKLMHENKEKEDEFYKILGSRIDFLKQFDEGFDLEKPRKQTERKAKDLLNFLILNFLTRKDSKESAECLSERLGLNFEIERELLKSGESVVEGINDQNLDNGLRWCEENRSKMIKNDSDFKFDLISQKFMNQLKEEDQEASAMYYIQDNLPQVQERNLNKLKKMMRGLVIGSAVKSNGHYRSYYDPKKYQKLENQFKIEQFEVEALPKRSLFEIILQAGICTLKTPVCSKSSHDDSTSAESGDESNCPICSTNVWAIAMNMPFTSKSRSHVICRLSKKRMSEDNPPVALPNNQVYSLSALESRASKKTQEVICPVTGNVYSLDSVTKIYLTS